MSISSEKKEISTIKNILKTIDSARKYFQQNKASTSAKLPKLLAFCDIAYRNWRNAELSLQLTTEDSPELRKQLLKWKNITKIYHCPDYINKNIDFLSPKERQDIIEVLSPLCKEFIEQTKQKNSQKGLSSPNPLNILKKPYDNHVIYEKKNLSRVNV